MLIIYTVHDGDKNGDHIFSLDPDEYTAENPDSSISKLLNTLQDA